MPKSIRGMYIKCERSIKKIIDKMNEEDKNIIAKDIDEFSCIVYKEKFPEVLKRIEYYQNKFNEEPNQMNIKK